jgi:hypothetical protein
MHIGIRSLLGFGTREELGAGKGNDTLVRAVWNAKTSRTPVKVDHSYVQPIILQTSALVRCTHASTTVTRTYTTFRILRVSPYKSLLQHIFKGHIPVCPSANALISWCTPQTGYVALTS